MGIKKHPVNAENKDWQNSKNQGYRVSRKGNGKENDEQDMVYLLCFLGGNDFLHKKQGKKHI